MKSSHKARKTFISKLLNVGMSPSKAAELAGIVAKKVMFDSYLFDTLLDAESKEIFETSLNH